MAGQSFPTLNNETQSWANVGIIFKAYKGASLSEEDIADISWKRTVDVGIQRKVGGQIKAKTVGQPDYESKCTLFSAGYDRLQQILADVAVSSGYVDGGGAAQIRLVTFDVQIQYTPMDKSYIREGQLEGCNIQEDGEDTGDGNEATKVAIDLHPIRIVTILSSGQKVVLL